MIEVIVVVSVLCLLALLLIPKLSGLRGKAARIQCVNNLKNIGLEMRVFSGESARRTQSQASTNLTASERAFPESEILRFFPMLSNAPPALLICPSDTRKPVTSLARLRNENISYFLGLDSDETLPSSLLAGDRNITTNGVQVPSGVLELTTNSVVGWSDTMHRKQGNVAMGDGSVQQSTIARLQAWLPTSGLRTNRLMIP